MIRRPLPAARLAQNLEITDRIFQRARDPDVVKPAAAVADGPIGGAVAPPRVDLLRHRNALARDVDPIPRGERGLQLLGFDGRVRYYLQKLLVRPDVVLMRGDVEIADQDVAVLAARMQRLARLHLVEEAELVIEFLVQRGIGNVA